MLLSEKQKLDSYSKKSRSRSRDNERESKASNDNKREGKRRSRSKDKKENKKKLKWVLPGIIVRVISKKVEGGKLYNKKMKVADVLNKYQFTLVPVEDNL